MGYTDFIVKKDYTEARIQQNRAEVAEKTAEALAEVRDELVKVLTEVAPDHPLTKFENRSKLYRKALADRGINLKP